MYDIYITQCAAASLWCVVKRIQHDGYSKYIMYVRLRACNGSLRFTGQTGFGANFCQRARVDWHNSSLWCSDTCAVLLNEAIDGA